MTVNISIPDDLAEAIRRIAKEEHRSFSAQVAFFCDRGMRDRSIPEGIIKIDDDNQEATDQ